ncbi:MAG: hypothetical protein LV479_00135 [Methylacidiphilales bacterium]|nr:hypothetical protein [Candidatus Methylacidiphilales bacterium]
MAVMTTAIVITVGSLWLFYTMEDSRGAHEWEAAKDRLRAAGEVTDFSDLIPPEIPDERNLAAIPLFRVDIAKDTESPELGNLNRMMAHIEPDFDSMPKVGLLFKGQKTDFGPVEDYLAKRYEKVEGHPPDKLDALAQFDALCQELTDLRQAALVRPQCRFPRDYVSMPPFNRPYGTTTVLLKLFKVINLHALVALHENRPDMALGDIEAAIKISDALRREPILISGLVGIGGMAIMDQSIWEGLVSHAWTDQQLDELQKQLQGGDFLSDYQLCLRGEATGQMAPMLDYFRDHRQLRSVIALAHDDDSSSRPDSAIAHLLAWLVPNGWFDLAKVRGLSIYFQAAREVMSDKDHRVYPEKSDQLAQKGKSGIYFYDMPDVLVGLACGPVINSAGPFATGQFRIDAIITACALERYRLAHGSYPASLDELGAVEAGGVPHDIMSGDAYHYALPDHGSYLLYSVGWNQVDDGGKIIYKADNPNAQDWKKGDWVWPGPPEPKTPAVILK